MEKPITPRALLALALCAALAPSAGAVRFEPEALRPTEATPSGQTPRGEAPRSEAPQGARMAVDARLVGNALKPGSVGLNEPGEWLARNTALGQTATLGEANGVGRTVLNRLMEAPDRANVSFEKDGVVHLQVESASLGYAAQFSEGQFDGFTEKLIKSPPPIETTAVRHLITTDPKSLTAAEFNAIGELITKSVLDSPERVNVIVTKPDGTRELHIQAPDMGMTLRYSPNADFLGFIRTPMEKPSLWHRTVAQVEKVGAKIKAAWENMDESGRVRIGKGLTVENATKNLRFTDLPTQEIKAFRASMSEAQLRSVAGMTLEEAVDNLPARHADKITAVQQAFAVAATKGDLGLLFMEPKVGPVLEYAMNETAPKEMLIKAKVDPVSRRILKFADEFKNREIIANSDGRYRIKNGYFFDERAGKFVSSDFDLAAVGSKKPLGGVVGDPALGQIANEERFALNTLSDTFQSRGFKADPASHGPQSNVQLPVDWMRNRMIGYLPGENRSYIIDSAKALGDYLNLATEKNLKFRIPDQWGVEPYLNPTAKNFVEITEYSQLPKP